AHRIDVAGHSQSVGELRRSRIAKAATTVTGLLAASDHRGDRTCQKLSAIVRARQASITASELVCPARSGGLRGGVRSVFGPTANGAGTHLFAVRRHPSRNRSAL